MNTSLLYPKTISDLQEKIEFIIKNDESVERINNMKRWLNWFSLTEFKLNYKLHKNEYLRAFSKGDDFALQVWVHNEIVDSIRFNLLCNHYSDFNREDTIKIKKTPSCF